eukprot:Tbor_TRINITY_DN3982_c0_g1::TRINITY_DN3982_c0_g1_i2::g.839::m.839
MVLLHSLRSLRALCKGYLGRKDFLKKNHSAIEALNRNGRQAPVTPFGVETCMQMYIGYRLIDIFGHVNNAKYLEICELARWHQLGLIYGVSCFRYGGIFPVVSSISMQYIRQIQPGRRVNVYTQLALSGDNTLCALHRIEGLPRKGEENGPVYAVMAIRLCLVNFPGIEPLGPVAKATKKTITGAIPMDEALERMGLKAEDFGELVFTPTATSKIARKPVTQCDGAADMTSGSTVANTVYPREVLVALNDRDIMWRKGIGNITK